MMKLFKTIDKKAGQMTQERFNTYGYIFILAFILLPMFCVGLHRWLSL